MRPATIAAHASWFGGGGSIYNSALNIPGHTTVMNWHPTWAWISAQLRAGTVWVNCFFVRDLGAPFGGSGQSGIGREGGTHSFDFYCDIKNTVFAPNGWTGQEKG